MYVVNAKSSWDVEADQNVVEITTDRWQPGIGWKKHTDFIYTRSCGNWTEIKFDRRECVKYANFLDTMVEKNIEVCRKIAYVKTLLVLATGSDHDMKKISKCMTILDPTFKPPKINFKSRWQREFLEHMCNEWSIVLINTCRNHVRLLNYSRKIELLFM
jgi:hypothetical protein